MTNFISTGATNYTNNTAFTVGKAPKVVSNDTLVDVSELTNGDTFELAQVGLSDRISAIVGTIPALTAAVDNDLGFYTKNEAGELVAIDADILWDGVDLSSISAYADQLIAKNATLDTTKTVGDHLSLGEDQSYNYGIFLVLTMNTKATTTDGTFHLKVHIEEGTAK